jgi:hypothetical protein
VVRATVSEKWRIYKSMERGVRGPSSMRGISDFNVEKALGGWWPLEPPKPNRVVGAKGRSMFQVDRTEFGLCYALRHHAFDVPRRIGRACLLVYDCSEMLKSPKFSNVRPEIPTPGCVPHIVLE